jgi:predicted PurR-regulated permease PerM
MGSLSVWHWLIIAMIWAAWIVPLYTILSRIGVNRGWAFVALFPFFGMVLLWVIAFIRWPADNTLSPRPDA